MFMVGSPYEMGLVVIISPLKRGRGCSKIQPTLPWSKQARNCENMWAQEPVSRGHQPTARYLEFACKYNTLNYQLTLKNVMHLPA